MTRIQNRAKQPLCGGNDASDDLACPEDVVRELRALSTVVDLYMAAEVLHLGETARKGEVSDLRLRTRRPLLGFRRIPPPHRDAVLAGGGRR